MAAHISGAASGPGSARYNAALTARERSSIKNGIWLCQTCSALVDRDELRYTEEVLSEWKQVAEQNAHRQVGKAVKAIPPSSNAERLLKRDLKVRDELEKALVRPWDEVQRERSRRGDGRERPFDKFCCSEIIIHRLGDDTYPDLDDRPGISPWFKVEPFDFYYRGLKVILGIESGVIENSPSYAGNLHWAIIPFDGLYDTAQFRRISVWRLGLIPFRNIRHHDSRGDEYYNCPHLYCDFCINSMPYEGFEHAVVAKDGEFYDWPLKAALRLPAEAVANSNEQHSPLAEEQTP